MILPGLTTCAMLLQPVAAPARAGATTGGNRVGWDPTFLIYSLIFVGVLLLGALIIAVVQRWRQLADRGGISPSDQLAQFRSLYEEGVISEEEFKRLRTLLGGKIRQEAEAPASKTPAEAVGQVKGTPPSPETDPQNPSGPPEPPETGIRQA
jgi:hypothetical protein